MKKLILFILASFLLVAGGASAKQPARQPVRNVIYMIGDGMGLSHMSMMKIEGGYAPTAFDRAHGVALISTSSANNRVTDSGAAGTALATGTKTGNGRVGLDMEGNELRSMMRRATDKGFSTGIVVTCYLQHATPATFYAHSKKRRDIEKITGQLLESDIDVLLGGGDKWLSGKSSGGESYYDAFRSRGYTVVDAIPAIGVVHSGRLLGVFAEEHLPPAPGRGDYLRDATDKALEILSNNSAKSKKGFMLMVEGSQIDYAAHANDQPWLLAEVRDFESAVAAAMDFADRTPGTLVVVTADHETGGLAIASNDADFTQAESGVKYIFGWTSHTGTHVPVYLYGTGADRITGVMDNTQLAHKIMEMMNLE